MKTNRFRIVPVAPNRFQVQRKGRFFWWTEKRWVYGIEPLSTPRTFETQEVARAYIDELLVHEANVRAHLTTPVEEYPA